MSVLSLNSLRNKKAVALAEASVAYAVFTETTAKYPSDITGRISAGLLYVSVGLANEVGELAELFYQEVISDANRSEQYGKAWKELGDVQWYAARLCAEMPELPTFDALVKRAHESLCEEVKRELWLSGFDLQLSLCAHSGRILGVVKKMMRDGDQWTPEKRAEKVAELQEALFCVIRTSVDFAERTGPLVGCEGGYVGLLRVNTDKLAGRKERGTLHGDGEVR